VIVSIQHNVKNNQRLKATGFGGVNTLALCTQTGEESLQGPLGEASVTKDKVEGDDNVDNDGEGLDIDRDSTEELKAVFR
jgi:hypothetical protein